MVFNLVLFHFLQTLSLKAPFLNKNFPKNTPKINATSKQIETTNSNSMQNKRKFQGKLICKNARETMLKKAHQKLQNTLEQC